MVLYPLGPLSSTMGQSTDIAGPVRDTDEIAERADLDDSVAAYASVILTELHSNDYQIPADGRTYAAVVYVAARDEGTAITLSEIAEASGVEETAVAREKSRVVDALDISPSLLPPSAFLDRYSDTLAVPTEVVSEAVDLVREGNESGLWGSRSAAVVAAACLYAADKVVGADALRQKDFEEVGVSRTSVRDSYREALSLRDMEESTRKSRSTLEGSCLDPLRDSVRDLSDEFDHVPAYVVSDALERVDDLDGEREWLVGKSVSPVAAAVLWLTADESRVDLTQSEVADAAGTHKVTVNRRVSGLRERIDV